MQLAQKVHSIAEMQGGEIPLPAGPAAGALNERTADAYIAHVRDVIKSPALVVPLGSICSISNDGNEVKFGNSETGELARVFYHNPQTGETVNSIGLKQFGIDEAIRILPETRKMVEGSGKLLKVSLSTIGDEDASKVLPELTERVLEAAGPDVVIEENFGCPNKLEMSGERHPVLGQDAEAVGLALGAIVLRVGHVDASIGAKLSYYKPEVIDGSTDYFTLKKVLHTINSIAGVDFVTLANTEIGVKLKTPDGNYALDKLPGNAGGGSGPAHRQSGCQQLLVAREELADNIDVISANGVWDGKEVRRRERAGAVFSEMVSRIWLQSEHEAISFSEVLTRVYTEYLTEREEEIA